MHNERRRFFPCACRCGAVYQHLVGPSYRALRSLEVSEHAAVEPALRLADSLVTHGGTLAIFSWHHHELTFDFGSSHVRGVTVLNTSPAAAASFTDCFVRSVPLIQSGLVDLAPFVTHVGGPAEAERIYRDGLSKDNGYIKGVIRWG